MTFEININLKSELQTIEVSSEYGEFGAVDFISKKDISSLTIYFQDRKSLDELVKKLKYLQTKNKIKK